ncbi:VOC family protein, partial [Streptomyces asiaticus]
HHVSLSVADLAAQEAWYADAFGLTQVEERLEIVAVQPEDGGAISAADYALGLVDLIEKGDHHRAQVNLGH